ncbi:MAG: L,D-transpeptidase Cds6 family protein [Pseudomonadota bacterium]
MSLLQEAMRQKVMRESQASGQDGQISSGNNAPTPPKSAKNRGTLNGLIASAVLIALVAGVISILPEPGDKKPPLILPAQQPATPEISVKSDEQPVTRQLASLAAPANTADNKEQEIKDFVVGWVKAWSTQNVEKYLSAYASEFKPENGLSRQAWEKQRHHRLTKYKKIEIELTNLTVSTEKDTATVEFIQSFRGDNFSETGFRKRLVLKLQDTGWMITRETGG